MQVNGDIRGLDYRAEAYVLDHLRGVNTLCAALHDIVAREGGEVFTLAPTNVPIEKLYRFDEGGLLPEDRSQAVILPEGQGTLVPIPSLIANRALGILDTISNLPSGVCIVDDYNPVWGETSFDLGPNSFGVGKECYHLLTGLDDLDAVELALQCGGTFSHGVAAVCATGPAICNKRESSVEELRKSAASVVEITCSAYDSEGFVGWRRLARRRPNA